MLSDDSDGDLLVSEILCRDWDFHSYLTKLCECQTRTDVLFLKALSK